MKLVELFEHIEKAMRMDGKSSLALEYGMGRLADSPKVVAKALADCVDPKYLPADFRSDPEIETDSHVPCTLVCYEGMSEILLYMRTFNTWYYAYQEMQRQYDMIAARESERDISDYSAYAYNGSEDLNLMWQICRNDSRIKHWRFDEIFNSEEDSE